MRHYVQLLVLVSLAAVTAAAAAPPASPPAEVGERIERALSFLDGDTSFVGSYLLTVTTDVDAPGDDGAEKTIEVQRITVHPDGSRTSRLIRAEKNGVDVTAERESEEPRHRETGRDDHDDVDADFDFARLPVGRSAHLYQYTRPKPSGGVLVSSFKPTREHRRDTDVARGELAWNEGSGDPVWLELEPEDLPTFVSELSLRFEFDRVDDTCFPSRIVTRTKAGIPFFKVKVLVDMAVSEVLSGDEPPL